MEETVMTMEEEYKVSIRRYRVKEGSRVRLSDWSTTCDGDVKKSEVKESLFPKALEEMKAWQEKLYAQNQYGLIVVL